MEKLSMFPISMVIHPNAKKRLLVRSWNLFQMRFFRMMLTTSEHSVPH